MVPSPYRRYFEAALRNSRSHKRGLLMGQHSTIKPHGTLLTRASGYTRPWGLNACMLYARAELTGLLMGLLSSCHPGLSFSAVANRPSGSICTDYTCV